jgi:hypothetical protein
VPGPGGQNDCRRVTLELRSGPDKGERSELTVGEPGSTVSVDVGDRLRVYANQLPPDAVVGGVRVDPWAWRAPSAISPT